MGMMKSSLHFLLDPDGVVTMNGDSGGPTFYEANGTSTLVAVVAWGSPVPGVDHRYRVDTPDSLDFIYNTLFELECEQ
jgi:secreted trypsin-like serine protease